jgi:cutinase
LENLPVIDDTLAAVIGVLTDFEQDIADLTGVQTTQNELGAGACTEWTIIFARGTTEPGNVGVLVGPPFFEALEALVGTSALTIQGVNDYPATIDEYLEGGSPTGSSEM